MDSWLLAGPQHPSQLMSVFVASVSFELAIQFSEAVLCRGEGVAFLLKSGTAVRAPICLLLSSTLFNIVLIGLSDDMDFPMLCSALARSSALF